MDMNSVNVEAIVKQVLEGMLDKQEAPTTTIAAPTACLLYTSPSPRDA